MIFQVDKSSRWSEDTLLKEYKQKIISRHSTNWTKTGCDSASAAASSGPGCKKLTKSYSDEFIKGFQNARKSSFDIKKLTKSELDFLMEYVCN